MSTENEKQPVSAPAALRIMIEWRPQVGQLYVEWPQIDDVMKMGMIEMAKSMLSESRIKNSKTSDSGLLLPRMQ